MSKVGIVVDSTCDMGIEETRALKVEVVPLKVLFGETTYLDGITISAPEFYEKLVTSPILPKTSQPSPMQFKETFAKMADAGFDSIVCITLTAALSGTYESATMAAEESSVPVYVINTSKVSQGFALIVDAAAHARDAGLNGEELAAFVQKVVDSSEMYFILDTIDYLVKGGRAGKASGLAASLLNIKPILAMGLDGVIDPFKKCKGKRRAITELARIISEKSQEGAIEYAVLYSSDIEAGREMEQALAGVDINGTQRRIGPVGPVVGTYAGPLVTGVAFYRLPS